MEPHQEVQVQLVAASTGALPLLGHIKTQEKYLTVIGALKLCIREKET